MAIVLARVAGEAGTGTGGGEGGGLQEFAAVHFHKLTDVLNSALTAKAQHAVFQRARWRLRLIFARRRFRPNLILGSRGPVPFRGWKAGGRGESNIEFVDDVKNFVRGVSSSRIAVSDVGSSVPLRSSRIGTTATSSERAVQIYCAPRLADGAGELGGCGRAEQALAPLFGDGFVKAVNKLFGGQAAAKGSGRIEVGRVFGHRSDLRATGRIASW